MLSPGSKDRWMSKSISCALDDDRIVRKINWIFISLSIRTKKQGRGSAKSYDCIR